MSGLGTESQKKWTKEPFSILSAPNEMAASWGGKRKNKRKE